MRKEKVCAECEYLAKEPRPGKRAYFKCTFPGEKQGRVVAEVPDWCTAAHVWDRPAWCGRKEKEDDAEGAGGAGD